MPETFTVVAGFTRSPEAQAAVQLAATEARVHGGELVVVHSSRGGEHERDEDVLADREALADLQARLAGEGHRVEVVDLVQGHPPEEDIVRVASERGAHLVVIGLRRRTPTGKALFGSTCQQVLLHAPCPVLAVPVRHDG